MYFRHTCIYIYFTVLQLYSIFCRNSLLCLLLQHSSRNTLHVNCQNKKGFAPLHIAVIENNMEVLVLLLKKGAFVNVQTHKHITPLHLACFHDQYEVSSFSPSCQSIASGLFSYFVSVV